MKHTDPDSRLGQRVERYELAQLLGVGGFGAVYRARHTVLQRDVALKLLHSAHYQTEAQLERFLREARTAASVGSRHIIEVYDGGVTREGEAFIAFALLEGEDLETTLARRGALPVHESVEIMEQLLAGLDAAHRAGVLHRDIKPSNVFLRYSAEGREVVLLDFGIAKALQADLPNLTTDGALMGTPSYMSPEQLFSPKDIDARADVYSAGVVLYEMLSGLLPYGAENIAQLVAQISDGPPRSLLEIIPGISPQLSAVVDRAVAQKAQQRFASASEFATELRAVLQTTPRGHGGDPHRDLRSQLGTDATLHSVPPPQGLSTPAPGLSTPPGAPPLVGVPEHTGPMPAPGAGWSQPPTGPNPFAGGPPPPRSAAPSPVGPGSIPASFGPPLASTNPTQLLVASGAPPATQSAPRRGRSLLLLGLVGALLVAGSVAGTAWWMRSSSPAPLAPPSPADEIPAEKPEERGEGGKPQVGSALPNTVPTDIAHDVAERLAAVDEQLRATEEAAERALAEGSRARRDAASGDETEANAASERALEAAAVAEEIANSMSTRTRRSPAAESPPAPESPHEDVPPETSRVSLLGVEAIGPRTQLRAAEMIARNQMASAMPMLRGCPGSGEVIVEVTVADGVVGVGSARLNQPPYTAPNGHCFVSALRPLSLGQFDGILRVRLRYR